MIKWNKFIVSVYFIYKAEIFKDLLYTRICYIFLEEENTMNQELFIKMVHHAYAPEYLSSYAYENIS